MEGVELSMQVARQVRDDSLVAVHRVPSGCHVAAGYGVLPALLPIVLVVYFIRTAYLA